MSATDATLEQTARAAKDASRKLGVVPLSARNEALDAMYEHLKAAKQDVLASNVQDMKAAEGQISPSTLKRLDLSRPGKYDDMLKGIQTVRQLADPLGKIDMKTELDDNLILQRQSCPIGVLLFIFEARPEVIVNIASLAIKSGNAAILKGGKESTETYKTIMKVVTAALGSTRIPADAIQLVLTRDAIKPLLKLSNFVDVVIARGSNELVRFVQENAHMPVLGHADGLCQAYVHSDADTEMVVKLVVDSKTDYPAVCNALEVLLVHQDVLETVFPAVARALLAKGVELRCDQPSRQVLQRVLGGETSNIVAATPQDFDTEFMDLVLAVKTIPASGDPVETAIEHVNAHGSHHTDLIITSSQEVATRFMNGIESACKFWNCSTRMADGQRFGFGAEVGISTIKVHARGPVGLQGLTIHEYRVCGTGQTSEMYSAQGGRTFKHRTMPLE